jgi:hypothetical protein
MNSIVKGRKKLDTVVKLGLGVFVAAFTLIGGGMFLSRPDRTIPPYSIGSQEGIHVAVHVPPWTSDAGIETLIQRFRKVGRETHDFGKMKIRPTTPDDPAGRYRRIVVYIFTDDGWTEAEKLHHYVTGAPAAAREEFARTMRGSYRLEGDQEEGRIGPLLPGKDTAGTAVYARELFKGSTSVPWTAPDAAGVDFGSPTRRQ